MDNVTHSLAGLVLAESIVQIRRTRGDAPSRGFHAIAGTVGVIAANLPDADLAYAGPIMGGGKLGYLLHHRGHTHTVIVALLGALLTYWIARAFWRRRHPEGTTSDARWLLALCVVGTLSHLVLDWTNSYGVHPFWPVNDRWFYGDAVFIVEPWLWVVTIPPLIFAVSRLATRVVLSALLVVILGLAWRMAMVPTGIAAALSIGVLVSLGAAALLTPNGRVAFALGAWLAVEGVFFVAAARARDALGGPGVTDIVLTPAVSNPTCLTALVVGTEGDSYVVRTAVVAPFAAWRAVDRCGAGGGGTSFVPSTRPTTAMVRWEYEWRAPMAELVALARDNCVVAAALRFIRVPAWSAVDSAMVRIADLRYVRNPGGGFAEVIAPVKPTTCPAHVPPWVPPARLVLR